MRRSGLTQPTLAGSAVLPGQAGGSAECGRDAGAALTAVPTFAACPAVTAGSAVTACAARAGCAVAARRGMDNGTQVDEAADSIEDGAGVGGHRGQRRSQKRTGQPHQDRSIDDAGAL
jgi:hypothetical protein